MPSFLHEALLQLFRNEPLLAPELLRDVLHQTLPEFAEARIESADLTDIQPAEYRADLVVLLLNNKPVMGIVVEAQLSRDDHKQYAWPVYVTNLRARIKCPVCLLVITADEAVARWAANPIELGGSSRFIPWVLSPAAVPEITDIEQAQRHPELAVFSAIAHGQDLDVTKSVQIAATAISASIGLDADRTILYVDLILSSITEAARTALKSMNPANYQFQSDFAKQYVALGKVEGQAEGKAEGKIELVIKLLTLKFGTLPDTVKTYLCSLSAAELDVVGERVLTAQSLNEVIGQ